MMTATAFRKAFPIKISVVPILGPVEHKEELVQSETVERNLHTHRASRNFRSYWYHFPASFEEFANLVKQTWPGSEIEQPTISDYVNRTLAMFCYENRILRELYWIGSGFQIWCQLLTHLIRARDSSLIVVDEPEVYLHADLQRQLIGLLRDFDADIVLATHSTEIMGEAEPADLVLIDKRNRAGERIKNVEKLQSALASVGSIHNITLSRLARSRRILFVEGEWDYKLMRMFARQFGLHSLASGLEIVPALSEGFGSWEKVASLRWGIERALGDQLAIAAIYDRDYFCDAHVERVDAELKKSLSFAHIHLRKELENYLLLPTCLDRALAAALGDRSKREASPLPSVEPISGELIKITEKHRKDVSSQRIGKEIDFRRSTGTKLDSSTLHAQASAAFDAQWSTLDGRLKIVPGKDVLAELRTNLSEKYGVSLPDSRIVSATREEDMPSDFLDLLKKLESFRSATVGA